MKDDGSVAIKLNKIERNRTCAKEMFMDVIYWLNLDTSG
jgi:hypothetical protein